MSFYMYLSSKDSKNEFESNAFNDFTIETNREIVFDNCRNWSFALTDLFLEGQSGVTDLVKSVVVLCDLATDSYIAGKNAPVMRHVPAGDDAGTSLFQPYYVGVSKSRTNRIRITLVDRELEPLNSSEWNTNLVLHCTFHFIQQHVQ